MIFIIFWRTDAILHFISFPFICPSWIASCESSAELQNTISRKKRASSLKTPHIQISWDSCFQQVALADVHYDPLQTDKCSNTHLFFVGFFFKISELDELFHVYEYVLSSVVFLFLFLVSSSVFSIFVCFLLPIQQFHH